MVEGDVLDVVTQVTVTFGNTSTRVLRLASGTTEPTHVAIVVEVHLETQQLVYSCKHCSVSNNNNTNG